MPSSQGQKRPRKDEREAQNNMPPARRQKRSSAEESVPQNDRRRSSRQPQLNHQRAANHFSQTTPPEHENVEQQTEAIGPGARRWTNLDMSENRIRLSTDMAPMDMAFAGGMPVQFHASMPPTDGAHFGGIPTSNHSVTASPNMATPDMVHSQNMSTPNGAMMSPTAMTPINMTPMSMTPMNMTPVNMTPVNMGYPTGTSTWDIARMPLTNGALGTANMAYAAEASGQNDAVTAPIQTTYPGSFPTGYNAVVPPMTSVGDTNMPGSNGAAGPNGNGGNGGNQVSNIQQQPPSFDAIVESLGEPFMVLENGYFTHVKRLRVYNGTKILQRRDQIGASFDAAFAMVYSQLSRAVVPESINNPWNDESQVRADERIRMRLLHAVDNEAWIDELRKNPESFEKKVNTALMHCRSALGESSLSEAIRHLCCIKLRQQYSDRCESQSARDFRVSCVLEAKAWTLRILQDWVEEVTEQQRNRQR